MLKNAVSHPKFFDNHPSRMVEELLQGRRPAKSKVYIIHHQTIEKLYTAKHEQ